MTRFRYFAHQALFKARLRPGPIARLKQSWLVIQGLSVGEGTRIRENLSINWPNQVAIGSKCNIQNDVCFEYCRGSYEPGRHIIIGDRTFIGRFSEFNITSSIIVGSDCLIASGCKFIDHNHGREGASPMRDQAQSDAPIVLEDDVWLGVNVVVLKGVNIGKGAVVGAGAVVTKSIPAFEIWAGIPARRVSHR